MSSDKLDKRIIEAADNHHPPYDEYAWKNMKQLLDKHLPEKKDNKRRFIYFLLFFFFVVGGSSVWYFTGKKKIVQVENTQSSIPNPLKMDAIKEIINGENKNVESQNIIKQTEFENKKEVATTLPDLKHQLVIKSKNSNVQPKDLMKQVDKQMNFKNEDVTSIVVKKEPANNKAVYDILLKNIKHDESSIKEFSNNNEEKYEVETAPIDLKASNEQSISITTDLTEGKEAITSDKIGEKIKKKGFFSISIAAGPDLSFVTSDKLGTTKIIGGVGVGYTFKNGLSVRTGFYTGRKVYSAYPDSYNPPAGFSQYYPILENVDADCKIYEIPVSLVYNFNSTKKQTWFAGAGLSSLIMKNEKYTYTYKYVTTGTSYKKDWTVYNENKHYFSILTLSGGYQYQFNKNISLSIEPYIKFPLRGVGYGKVKLNSTGVLFTISLKPFNSKDK